MKSVTLTEAEAKVVQQALDAAIRQGGANAAVIVLPIMQAIERQLAAPAESFGQPQATFAEASAEAVTDLASPNP
jgi:hypothetical protein